MIVVLGTLAEKAWAQFPPVVVDRNYRMGDGDPGAANGVTVGPGTPPVTRDDAGALGMNQLIDLIATTRAGGLPQYATSTGRPDGVAGLGVRLNPTPTSRQFLRTSADEAREFPGEVALGDRRDVARRDAGLQLRD